jgi:DNA-binding CsgD family transcriptional regulator
MDRRGAPRDLVVDVFHADGARMAMLAFRPDGASPLTPAEHRIAVAILRGRSNADIARDLGISVHTVAVHVTSLLHKLRVGSRAQLAARLVPLLAPAKGDDA